MYELITLEEWEIKHHRRALDSQDRCYYYMKYDPLSDLKSNYEKQTIKNIKISQEDLEENPNRGFYKTESIKEIAQWLINTLTKYPVLKNYLWLTAPSSKLQSDKDYDNRLQQILSWVEKGIDGFQWCDAISVKSTTVKSRVSNDRRVKAKLDNLLVNEKLLQLIPSNKIVVFDDVITTGATFKASQLKIKEFNNNLQIIGIFIAKTVSKDET